MQRRHNGRDGQKNCHGGQQKGDREGFVRILCYFIRLSVILMFQFPRGFPPPAPPVPRCFLSGCLLFCFHLVDHSCELFFCVHCVCALVCFPEILFVSSSYY